MDAPTKSDPAVLWLLPAHWVGLVFLTMIANRTSTSRQMSWTYGAYTKYRTTRASMKYGWECIVRIPQQLDLPVEVTVRLDWRTDATRAKKQRCLHAPVLARTGVAILGCH